MTRFTVIPAPATRVEKLLIPLTVEPAMTQSLLTRKATLSLAEPKTIPSVVTMVMTPYGAMKKIKITEF